MKMPATGFSGTAILRNAASGMPTDPAVYNRARLMGKLFDGGGSTLKLECRRARTTGPTEVRQS